MAAGRIKGITIEIGGDTTKLVKALASVDNAISRTQANLRDINKALKFDPTSTTLLKDKQQELGKQIEATEKRIEEEKKALEQLNEKLNQPFDLDHAAEFQKNAKAAEDLKLQIDLDTAALKQLGEEAKQASSIIGIQMQAVGQKFQEVGEKIKSVGDKIAGIGSSLTTTVTAPIVGAFGASAKAAVDWETAFTGVQKTVDATDEEFSELATNIKKMATETASSANDIAGVMEISGQLGIEGVEGLTNFTRTMVELGDTTNLTSEEAATSLARFINITGESSESIDRIGSAIVDLGNNFATSESEIVAMSTRLASAGTMAGMTSTDILALSTAMSSVGIEAEAGGTAMTQTLNAMTRAVADFEIGSTKDLEKIAGVANMSAESFAKSWNENPIEALQNFISGLGSLDEKGENATLVLDELGMKGIRQSNMLRSLALASDVLSEAVTTSSEAYKENTALSEEAEKRYGTMAAKMQQLKNRITEVGVEIGEILMPYIEKFMGIIEQLVEKWKALDDAQKNQIIQIAAVVAAIGPALVIIGNLISSIGTIVSTIGSLTSGVGSLLTSFGGLQGVMAALTGPIGIVVAAVAALAAGFAYLFATNEEFRKSVTNVASTLKDNLIKVIDKVKPKINELGERFQSLMTTLAPVFEGIFAMVVAMVNGIIATIEPIVTFISGVIEVIMGIFQTFFSLLTGDWEGFWEGIESIIKGACNIIEGFINAGTALWQGIMSTFGVNLKTNVTEVWEKVKSVISEKITQTKSDIETKWNNIKSWLATTLSAIWSKFKEIFENIKRTVSEKISQTKNDIESKWNNIKSSLTTILNNILSKFKEIFENIRKAVKEKIDGVRTSIEEGMRGALNYLASLPGQFFSWGHDMIQNLIDGIRSKFEDFKNTVVEIADTIAEYVHFSEPDKGPLSNFHTFMPDMINLMIAGINNGLPKLENAMSGLAGGMASQVQGGSRQEVTTNNAVNITVYGAVGQNVSELADIIEQRIAENTMRRGVAGI